MIPQNYLSVSTSHYEYALKYFPSILRTNASVEPYSLLQWSPFITQPFTDDESFRAQVSVGRFDRGVVEHVRALWSRCLQIVAHVD